MRRWDQRLHDKTIKLYKLVRNVCAMKRFSLEISTPATEIRWHTITANPKIQELHNSIRLWRLSLIPGPHRQFTSPRNRERYTHSVPRFRLIVLWVCCECATYCLTTVICDADLCMQADAHRVWHNDCQRNRSSCFTNANRNKLWMNEWIYSIFSWMKFGACPLFTWIVWLIILASVCAWALPLLLLLLSSNGTLSVRIRLGIVVVDKNSTKTDFFRNISKHNLRCPDVDKVREIWFSRVSALSLPPPEKQHWVALRREKKVSTACDNLSGESLPLNEFVLNFLSAPTKSANVKCFGL